MESVFKDLQWTVDVCRHDRLDQVWRTENFALRTRIIPFSRLYMPLKGEGTIEHSGQLFRLLPGALYLIPPFAAAKVNCPEYLEMYWMNFNILISGGTLDLFSVIRTSYELDVPDENLFRSLFEMILPYYTLSRRAGVMVPVMAEFACRAALMLLVRPFLAEAEKSGGLSVREQGKFFSLLCYIEENLGHPMSLKELAAFSHLNPTYLTNLFARNMGYSLIRYCNIRRLNHALRMLSDTDLSISEIAYSLGANDVNNFSSLFKRHYGISPRNFRLSNTPGIISKLKVQKKLQF